jgi:hypothetical protein
MLNNGRQVLLLALLALLGLLVPGCEKKVASSSSRAFFDDVGEIDVDARERGRTYEVGQVQPAATQQAVAASRTQAPIVARVEQTRTAVKVTSVPAPPPAPEYRSYVTARPPAQVDYPKPHHSSNVGEIEVGY